MTRTPSPRNQAGASGVAFLLQLERRLRLLHDTGEILALSAQLLGQRLADVETGYLLRAEALAQHLRG